MQRCTRRASGLSCQYPSLGTTRAPPGHAAFSGQSEQAWLAGKMEYRSAPHSTHVWSCVVTSPNVQARTTSWRLEGVNAGIWGTCALKVYSPYLPTMANVKLAWDVEFTLVWRSPRTSMLLLVGVSRSRVSWPGVARVNKFPPWSSKLKDISYARRSGTY